MKAIACAVILMLSLNYYVHVQMSLDCHFTFSLI